MSDDNVVDMNEFKNKSSVPHITKSEAMIDISIAITHDIVEKLEDAGYSLEESPEIGYDLIMITEAIKSVLHTAEGEYYPLHKIAEGLFDSDEVEEFLAEFIYTEE